MPDDRDPSTFTPVHVYRDPYGGEWLDPNFTQPLNRGYPGGSGFPPAQNINPSFPGGGNPSFDRDPTLGDFGGSNTNDYGGGQQAGTGQNWWNTYWGQALINSGINLAGGYLQGKATDKANKANVKAMEDRIKLALQQLSPEQIGILVKQYLPEIQSVMGPLQQTALQQMNVSSARQGLANTPYKLTAEAGLRGQMANQTSTAAFERAMQTANARVGAITGTPLVQVQPNNAWANAFSNTANQMMLARALGQKQQPAQTPYMMPGGRNVGGPEPWEIQQYEGTPYQWNFNPARY